MSSSVSLSAAALDAWRQSALGSVELRQCDRLLAAATGEVVRAGELIAEGPRPPGELHTSLIVSGLVRIYRKSGGGADAPRRQVTLGYRRPAQLIGLAQVLAPQLGPGMQLAAVEAVADCELLHLPAERFLEFVTSDPAVARIMLAELGGLLLDAHDFLTENVFFPVRRRVARHLLDLAIREAGVLKVQASQQDVANAIGSVREVVSRTIVGLRDEHLILRDGMAYVLIDPAGLHRVASGET